MPVPHFFGIYLNSNQKIGRINCIKSFLLTAFSLETGNYSVFCFREITKGGPSLPVSRIIRQLVSAFLGHVELLVIRFVAITFLIIGLVCLVLACWTAEGGINIFGSHAGGDYSTFYVAGTILNQYAPDRLYDFGLQSKLYHSLLPDIPATVELPFINSPFFALLFRPLSLLPYIPSYLAWIVFSTALYVTGLALVRKTYHAIPLHASKIALLLALSFEPFLIECAIGGNSSAFGFFAIALALYFERRGMHIASGMALGLCLYKPTLLLLILPMLFVARRVKTLMGFVISGSSLAGISFLTLGWQPCFDYMQILLRVSRGIWNAEVLFRTWKYVDILSFFSLLFGGVTLITWFSVLIVVLASIPFLIDVWWKFNRLEEDRRDLVWACTLTWTAFFNLHFAIYDTVIVVVAIVLTVDVLYRYSSNSALALPPAFRVLLVLLYVTPWISQSIARFVGFQIFSTIIAATGWYQLLLSRAREVGTINNQMGGSRATH